MLGLQSCKKRERTLVAVLVILRRQLGAEGREFPVNMLSVRRNLCSCSRVLRWSLDRTRLGTCVSRSRLFDFDTVENLVKDCSFHTIKNGESYLLNRATNRPRRERLRWDRRLGRDRCSSRRRLSRRSIMRIRKAMNKLRPIMIRSHNREHTRRSARRNRRRRRRHRRLHRS